MKSKAVQGSRTVSVNRKTGGKICAAVSCVLACLMIISSCAVRRADAGVLPDPELRADEPASTAAVIDAPAFAYVPSYPHSVEQTEDGGGTSAGTGSGESSSETGKTTKPSETTKAAETTKAEEIPGIFSVEELDALDDLESYFAGFENAHDDDDDSVNDAVDADPDATDAVIQTLFGPTEFYSVPLSYSKQQVVMDIADDFGISPVLIFGVMYAETHYNADNGISANGKYIGVMQIAKGHLTKLNAKFGITDLQDYIQNVTAGAYYLSYYTSFSKRYNTKEFGERGDIIDMTLMCYHRGEGNALKLWRQGTFTDSYCTKVRNEMARIVKAGPVTPTSEGNI